MADIVVPRALRHARNQFRYIDQTGVTRGLYTGAAQTTSFGGDRIGASIEFTQAGGASSDEKSRRAQMIAFLMALRGKQNRVYMQDEAYTLRGSFPATELFTNADFSNGTTGWSTDVGIGTLSVSDGVGRITALSVGAGNPEFFQTVAGTIYAPHVLRSLLIDGADIAGIMAGQSMSLGPISVSNYSTTRGYGIVSGVLLSASALTQFPVVFNATSGYKAGAYLNCPFASYSRCFLVDGGGNILLRSDELNTGAVWTTNGVTGISANTATAPDGTATADVLEENGAATTHFVQQAVTVVSTAAEYSFSVCVKAVGRTWCALEVVEATGSTAIIDYFDVINAVVGAAGATGANWSVRRSSIASMGAGWYRCTITGRKTNAATALTFRIYAASADGTVSYTGSSFSSISMWRATASNSSTPSRLTQTTTVAIATSTQTGSGIWVKGLPASTSGLLLAGDWIEIDGQLKMVVTPLNSDGGGLAYLQFSPPLRRAVSDNTPIIVYRPMGRFLYAGDNPGWDNVPGVVSTASIELEEAFS